VAVLILVSARPIHAVTVIFGETIDRHGFDFVGGVCCSFDYGLGIDAGDHFSAGSHTMQVLRPLRSLVGLRGGISMLAAFLSADEILFLEIILETVAGL
jgi:hypothetical protein